MSDPTPAAEPSADRRGYSVALGLLALGAVGLIVAYGRTWITASVGGSGLPTISVALTGADIAGAGIALAVLALAGIAALVATRSVGRRFTGGLLLVAGAAAADTSWSVVSPFLGSTGARLGSDAAILRVVSEHAGIDAAGSPISVTSWWVVGLVSGLLVAVGGLLAMLRSGSWPEMGRRYERAEAEQPGAPARRTESAWDRLDRGEDPTADPASGPTADTSTDPTLGGGGDA